MGHHSGSLDPGWRVATLPHFYKCVCVPLVLTGIHSDCADCVFNFVEQGGAEHSGDCTQRSYPLVLEAEPDQLCVPA